ncbi:MAG: hypothetical protein IJX94_00835 [Clostridia bacterium]|nr:hypothetical protein [Clostridia bacterium]
MNTKAIAKAIPGKALTMAQSICLAVLLLVICFTSFGSMFTLDVDMDAESRVEVAKMINDMSGDKAVNVEIPEKIEVSLPFMIKSVGAIGDVVKSVSEMAKDAKEADGYDDSEALDEKTNDMKDTAKNIVSQDLVNLIVFFFALFASFKSSIVLGLCHLFLLAMVFVVPIVALINTLIGVIGLLCNLKEPNNAMRRVSNGFSGVLAMFPLLLLVKLLIPDLQLGSGIVTMLVMCCIGLGVSLVCSRLKYYEKPDFKYLNVMQGLSACSLGAFLLFFLNIANSDIMATIFKRLGSYAVNEVKNTVASAAAKQTQSPDVLPILLVLVFVVVLFLTVNYLAQIFTRLACMSKSKSDSHIVTTSIALLVIVIPVILMNTEFELKLNDADSSAFVMVCVGLILMLAIEIVMKALSKSLCGDVPAERRKEIVTGSYVYEEAVEAPAEEVAAEEAVEAPVEEVIAEEAPVEEATEAPVEEETK